jgi:hypothetical protein
MTEYRIHWLLAGISCSLLAACILTVTLLMAASAYVCTREMTEHIGEFDSKEAGVRAAIPKLAAETRRCPEAETYRIIFVAPEIHPWHQGIDRRSLFYHRQSMTIGYEADVFSGYVGKTYVVDDAAIQSVAQKRGTLDDFAEYEHSHR